MYQGKSNKSLTGECRLSYVHLAKAYVNPSQSNAEPKYSVTLLIPKTDTATYQDVMTSISAAISAAVPKTWNGVKPPVPAIPIHDGDGVRQDGSPFGPECRGMWVMTASRREQDGKPWVCDISNPNVELAPQDIYSGAYARCTVEFFGYFNSGKKGIGCSLSGVMKTRDGESLGGVMKPTANEFAQFAQAGTPMVNPLTGEVMG